MTVVSVAMTCGCSYVRQVIDPDLRALCRQYGATSSPFEDRTVIFNSQYMDDEVFAKAFPHVRKARPEELNLNGRQISDLSVPLLLQLRSLRNLHLQGTDISLSGLKQLQELPRLEWLFIAANQFTDAEVAELRASLPGVNVYESYLVIDDGRSDRVRSSPQPVN